MKFTDFFKRITAKYKAKEQKTEPEEVSLDGLENWVKNKRKEIENREKELSASIKDKISVVVNDFDEKIKVLEGIDVEEKKVEEKIKFIVKENLNNYLSYVKDFKKNLTNLEEKGLTELITEINKIFFNFDKKSYKSYQKATFLIGKEMADVKNIIIDFSKYLKGILNDDKSIFDTLKMIFFIKLRLKQVNETNEIINRINKNLEFLNEKIKALNKNNEELSKEIENIKKSESYLENLKKQEEVKSSKKELENEIYKLKSMIDFKALANFFHVFEGQMSIIKTHKEKFKESFQKDNGACILRLLDESKLNNEAIISKIQNINSKKQEIIKNNETITNDETINLSDKIQKAKLEIEKLEIEKIKESKRCEKIKASREEIIDLIKNELSKINIALHRD